MQKLTKETFNTVSQFLKENARELEKYLFEYYFYGGSSSNIIAELKKYQNDDGGFGHGLEADIRQPLSSPIVTSVGVRLLSEFDDEKEAKETIKSAIVYFESTFNEQRKGWFALTNEVNNYPHAPWWHYDEEEGMTIIDKNWGNPSAEILAYLYKYRQFASKLDIDYLVEFAVQYIENKEQFASEHELFCYLKLFEVLPEELKNRLSKRIAIGISQVIEYDKGKWHEYVPKPLDFVPSPEKYMFGVEEAKIAENLDFYIELLESKGLIIPPWGDIFYQGDFQPAYNEWKGVLTLKVLKSLDDYGRIAK